MNYKPIRFVHISDTHIGPAEDFVLYSVKTSEALQRMCEDIAALPFKPDFLIHTGDVAARGDAESYQLADRMCARLKVPCYFVTGNHDISSNMKNNLTFGPYEPLTQAPESLDYRFECAGRTFVVLDGRGPDEIDPHGVIPEVQLTYLEHVLEESGAPVTVFLHFPPLPLDSAWLNKEMLLLNGAELHESLAKYADNVGAVFFGHVHRNMQIVKEGIAYFGVGSSFCQFTSQPDDERVTLQPQAPCFYNLVTILADQTIVKEVFLTD
ncbi:MAG: hypothetical protein GF398_18210 [Chitinivibrionales bacterium]|nr:hypothetical protein [Chitinivibrionales bacterium]